MITYTHQQQEGIPPFRVGETSGGGLASSTVIFSLPLHSQQVIESSNTSSGQTFLVSLPALIPADTTLTQNIVRRSTWKKHNQQ
jgi:hypothetical protein